MLYNPLWNTEPSLEGLIAWLETKPPETTYNFMTCRGTCLYGQYMTAIGIDWNSTDSKHKPTPYIYTVKGIGTQHIASHEPNTFGAALERARAELQNRR